MNKSTVCIEIARTFFPGEIELDSTSPPEPEAPGVTIRV